MNINAKKQFDLTHPCRSNSLLVMVSVVHSLLPNITWGGVKFYYINMPNNPHRPFPLVNPTYNISLGDLFLTNRMTNSNDQSFTCSTFVWSN